jgi:hypothetical protein
MKIKMHKNIIFPCVLYWYENWSLIFREETGSGFPRTGY